MPDIITTGAAKSPVGAKLYGQDSVGAPCVVTAASITSHEYRQKTPLVTFVDDDGDSAVWNRLKPVFDAAAVPCVVCIPSNYVNTAWSLTDTQLRALQDDGWEIASHSKSHPVFEDGVTTEQELIDELSLSKFELTAYGLNISSYVYPGGVSWERYAQLSRQYYRSAVVLGERTNIGPLHTWQLGRRHFGNGAFTLAQQKAAVDAAISSNAWLIFCTHADESTMNEQDLLDLAELITYIQTAAVPIVTLNDGMDVAGNLADFGYYPWQPSRSAGFATGPYNIIACDGGVATNPRTTLGIAPYVSALDQFTPSSVPSDFLMDKITYTTISYSGRIGFPDDLPGTLVTMRIKNIDGAGDDGTRQIYYAYDTIKSWERLWTVGSAWTAWEKNISVTNQTVILSALNAYTAADGITVFPLGQITLTTITPAGAADFPGAAYGLLETSRLYNTSTYSFQTYRTVVGSLIYRRSALTLTTWSDWVLTRATAQADSSAADLAALKVDFNALLAKLRLAGVMST